MSVFKWTFFISSPYFCSLSLTITQSVSAGCERIIYHRLLLFLIHRIHRDHFIAIFHKNTNFMDDDRATKGMKRSECCDSIFGDKNDYEIHIIQLTAYSFSMSDAIHVEEKQQQNCLWRHLIHFIYLMQIEWVNYSFSARFIIRLPDKNGFCHWNRYDMVWTETERAMSNEQWDDSTLVYGV